MLLKLFKIAGIVTQRMRADAALVFEVLQELGEVFVQNLIKLITKLLDIQAGKSQQKNTSLTVITILW